MKYYAYYKQDGEGCDYTIGCGQKMSLLEATDKISAEKEMEDMIIENYSHDEVRLSEAILIEASDVITIDIAAIYAKKADAEKKEKDERQKAKDLAEFERLKKQFGQ